MSICRLYRVTGVWPTHTLTRHYLTRRARDTRAQVWRNGREGEQVDVDDWRDDVPPATEVHTADSDPVTWP